MRPKKKRRRDMFKRKKYPLNCKHCVHCSTLTFGPFALVKYCDRKKIEVCGKEAKRCRLIKWKH